jgi:hypothetical protein
VAKKEYKSEDELEAEVIKKYDSKIDEFVKKIK